MGSSSALDSSIRSANFESLQQTFFYETGAVGAARLVRPYGNQRRLDWLLRDHTAKKVTNLAEVHLRDLFDDLFSFYSLVEIGAQISAVPEPLPHTFQTIALRVLTNSACRAYYIGRYPLQLPQALLNRLEKSDATLRENGPMEVAVSRFQQLLAFELRFRSDDEIRIILRLLDGFRVGGENLASLILFAKDVENYKAAVSSPRGERDTRARALRGFGKLIAAMLRLDTLLSDCEPCILLQSSIWHYYAYWIRRVASKSSLIKIISSWQTLPAAEDAVDERNALVAYIAQVQAAFQRLTSSRYRRMPILSIPWMGGPSLADDAKERDYLKGRQNSQPKYLSETILVSVGSSTTTPHSEAAAEVLRVTIVRLPELVNERQQRGFLESFTKLTNVDRPLIVLDCSEIREANNVTMHLLLSCLEETIKHNGDVKLAGVNAEVFRSLQATRLDRLFAIFDKAIDAAESFSEAKFAKTLDGNKKIERAAGWGN